MTTTMDSESSFLVTSLQDSASHSPPSSATAAAEDDYEANSEINILKMQMMLSWTDREKTDLEIVIQALKTENSALKAQFRNSKLDESTATQGLQEEITVLKALIQELQDNEAGETLKLQKENMALKAHIQRSQAGETAAVERLQEQNDRLKAASPDLQKRNDELMAELASLKEGIRKTAKTIHAQSELNKQALSDLRGKLDVAEKDRNRYVSSSKFTT